MFWFFLLSAGRDTIGILERTQTRSFKFYSLSEKTVVLDWYFYCNGFVLYIGTCVLKSLYSVLLEIWE